MDRAAANAKYDRLHEKTPFHDGTFEHWAKERSVSHPYSHRDGVTIWLADTDLSPDDHFLGGSAPGATDD